MTTVKPRSVAWASWRPWAWRVLALAALAAVFMAYQNPHLAVDLANRAWACV
jgi:hypothetical protein